MTRIIEFISSLLMAAMIPVLFFIYLFILVLLAMGELFLYVFDKADRDRANLIKKFLKPLQKR